MVFFELFLIFLRQISDKHSDLHTYNKQGVMFYTETKTITSRWQHKQTKIAANMTTRLSN